MNVPEYVGLFNTAVHTGQWQAVVESFTDDGVLEFVGGPVGPMVGRSAIASAYATNPPDDEIELTDTTDQDGVTLARYRWVATGDTGTMRFTERNGLIARLVVGFDR